MFHLVPPILHQQVNQNAVTCFHQERVGRSSSLCSDLLTTPSWGMEAPLVLQGLEWKINCLLSPVEPTAWEIRALLSASSRWGCEWGWYSGCQNDFLLLDHGFPLARENRLFFTFGGWRGLVCWQFQSEAPTAPSMGYMGGNNKNQGTYHYGVPQVPRSLGSPPTFLISQTPLNACLLCYFQCFKAVRGRTLNVSGIFHLGWNQKIDFLPEGGITLKDPPSSRNLVETIVTTSHFNSFLCLILHPGLLQKNCSQEHSINICNLICILWRVATALGQDQALD